MSHVPRPESTHGPEQPSEAPEPTLTPDGAREVLVEQLAEAIGLALATSWVLNEEAHEALTRARTEAAVSVVRAELEREVIGLRERRDDAQRARDREEDLRLSVADDLRALREGLEALAGRLEAEPFIGGATERAARDIRALLAPSPAEGTGEHDCAECADCIHNGRKCCGCYDGACCKRARAEASA